MPQCTPTQNNNKKVIFIIKLEYIKYLTLNLKNKNKIIWIKEEKS
jgi:hypothetical protein